jgi:hypothetical protein
LKIFVFISKFKKYRVHRVIHRLVLVIDKYHGERFSHFKVKIFHCTVNPLIEYKEIIISQLPHGKSVALDITGELQTKSNSALARSRFSASNRIELLRQFESIFKTALAHELGDRRYRLKKEKTEGRKSREPVPFIEKKKQ